MTYRVYKRQNGRIEAIQVDNYTIFFGGIYLEAKRPTIKDGGVAFLKHNTLVQNILQINRVNGGVVGIRFKTGRDIPNLSVLSNYAENMGYNTDDVEIYWRKISCYTNTIPSNLVKIRLAGNNGQIAKDKNVPNNNLIGNWDIEKRKRQRR